MSRNPFDNKWYRLNVADIYYQKISGRIIRILWGVVVAFAVALLLYILVG